MRTGFVTLKSVPRPFRGESRALGQALAYVRALARRGRNPLTAVLGSRRAPRPMRQYPDGGIHWITGGLGYFYHSHGAAPAGTPEHGHFHLFAQEPGRGAARTESYRHLLAVGVDAAGAPRRLFTTNRWVTAGEWRPSARLREDLGRFARLAGRRGGGPERWLGLILRLFPAEVREVLRLRERRVREWRDAGTLARRLADRRIHVVSAVTLPMPAVAAP